MATPARSRGDGMVVSGSRNEAHEREPGSHQAPGRHGATSHRFSARMAHPGLASHSPLGPRMCESARYERGLGRANSIAVLTRRLRRVAGAAIVVPGQPFTGCTV